MPEWYANPDPTFQPAMRLVTDITKTNPAVVTTSFDHDYLSGTIVRLYVPQEYGMRQANYQFGSITVLTTDTFSLEFDSTHYDSFSAPAGPPYYSKAALCIPIGNLQCAYNAAVQNVL